MLFVGFLEQPLPEDIHRAYHERSQQVPFTDEAEKHLLERGYSDEAVKQLRAELKKVGMA